MKWGGRVDWPKSSCKCIRDKKKRHQSAREEEISNLLYPPGLLGTITYPLLEPLLMMIFLFPRCNMWSFPGENITRKRSLAFKLALRQKWSCFLNAGQSVDLVKHDSTDQRHPTTNYSDNGLSLQGAHSYIAHPPLGKSVSWQPFGFHPRCEVRLRKCLILDLLVVLVLCPFWL